MPFQNKTMSLNGIRSKPWQLQAPPPEVDEKRSSLGSAGHTGRSWISLKTTSSKQIDTSSSLSWSLASVASLTCRAGSAALCVQTAAEVETRYPGGRLPTKRRRLSKWRHRDACETCTEWTCQSTGPASSTSETSCLCARRARWMASSALWGKFCPPGSPHGPEPSAVLSLHLVSATSRVPREPRGSKGKRATRGRGPSASPRGSSGGRRGGVFTFDANVTGMQSSALPRPLHWVILTSCRCGPRAARREEVPGVSSAERVVSDTLLWCGVLMHLNAAHSSRHLHPGDMYRCVVCEFSDPPRAPL